MLYLIGLGLNIKGISLQGLEAIKKCRKIYLENYTVDFPYELKELEKSIDRRIFPAPREFVENKAEELLKDAEKENIALLIYGSPLTATTHISLIQEAEKNKIKYEIIYSASIIDAISQTGLQIYKFGKIASMPKHEASSFFEIIKENQKIHAHSLILVDIGLELNEALKKLGYINKEKILICSQLGTENSEIFYGKISNLKKKKIKKPFCIVLPGKLHFVEEEFLENFKDA